MRDQPVRAEVLSPPAVTVGLIGPHWLLQQIVLAAGLPGPVDGISRPDADTGSAAAGQLDTVSAAMNFRLISAPYTSEQSAPERMSRLVLADACLFASRAPLEYARQAGGLSCPATFIQLADGPLIAALLLASRDGADPARASFDTFRRREVAAALAATGASARRAHVRHESASPAVIASYHARLWQLGHTTIAITCLEEVARRLTAAGVPVVTVRPSDQAVAAALTSAVLLARQHALAASQLAAALVEVPELREDRAGRVSRQARDELRLAVHRLLLREAQRAQSAISPVSDSAFLVTGTAGSLLRADQDGPPFAAAVAGSLGVAARIGVGTGPTQHAAEDAARRRLTAAEPARPVVRRRPAPASRPLAAATGATSDPSRPAGSVTAPDRVLPPSAASHGRPPDRAAGQPAPSRAGGNAARLRSLDMLARLCSQLADDGPLIVDAETASQLLAVTPRTARRQLRALADEGLALPMPPERAEHPGRPRQAYRLVAERLSRSTG